MLFIADNRVLEAPFNCFTTLITVAFALITFPSAMESRTRLAAGSGERPLLDKHDEDNKVCHLIDRLSLEKEKFVILDGMEKYSS